MMVAGRQRRVDHGFTLIELLVVVAIISLLVAILLPALGRAREQAKTVVCTSNLRQIAMTGILYITDYEGNVLTDGSTMTVNGYTGIAYWYCWYNFSPAISDPTHALLAPYSPNPKIYLCPTVSPGSLQPILPGITLTSYAITHTVSNKSLKIYSFTNPRDTIFFSESAFLNGSQLTSCNDLGTPTTGLPYDPGQPNIYGTHGKKAVTAWFDGHTSVEPVFLNVNPTYTSWATQYHIGYLTSVASTSSYTQMQKDPNANYYFWYDKAQMK